MQTKFERRTKALVRAASVALILGVSACAATPGANIEASLGAGSGPALVELYTEVLSDSDVAIPRFEVDAAWPELPSDWIIGQAAGVDVDANDNIWIVHRPATFDAPEIGLTQDPPTAVCCRPAPPVLQFSPSGELLAAWGGPEDAPDIDGVNQWPVSMHGVFIDEAQTVWLAGNGAGDHVVLHYTMDGEYLGQFGRREQTGGDLDTETLGRPADINLNPETGEMLVADGYGNHRIFGFDTETNEFTRFWGAYGNEPAAPSAAGDGGAAPTEGGGRGGADSPAYANPVHCILRTSDGDMYVCDRVNNRLQMFRDTADGGVEFVQNIVLAPETGFNGTATDVALSPDETYLYVADMSNGRVWVLLRETHEPLAVIGRNGRYAGEFTWLHTIAVDSVGNIYTTEVYNGRRAQKLVLVGEE
ncbi:MAG: hypothetical protein PVI23_02485 [Maricaulaceae bacterium]|jgi:hypothetical protein